jgi:hypothetical protein
MGGGSLGATEILRRMRADGFGIAGPHPCDGRASARPSDQPVKKGRRL